MTQVRKTDVTGQSILLMKNIIAAKGYSRERVRKRLLGPRCLSHDVFDDFK